MYQSPITKKIQMMMKNRVVIEIDDDKENPVTIQKLGDNEKPNNEEEVKALIKKDIETVAEGLMTLLEKSSEFGVSDKEANIRYIVKHLLKSFSGSDNEDLLKKIVYKNTNDRKLDLERRIRKAEKEGKKPLRSKSLNRIN